MKRSIYIIGIFNLILLMAACLFKVMHWPGAGIMLTVSIVMMVAISVPSALINNYRNSNNKHKLLYWSIYICVLIDFVGMLFKILQWPGANYFIWIGVPLPFVFFLPVYLRYYNRSKIKNINHFAAIIFLMVYIAIYSVLLAINISYKVIAESVRFNDKTEHFNNNLKQINEQKYMLFSENIDTSKVCSEDLEKYHKGTNLLYSKLQNLESQITSNEYYNFKNMEDEDNPRNIYLLTKNKHTYILFTENNKELIELSENIYEYISFSSGFTKFQYNHLTEFANAIQSSKNEELLDYYKKIYYMPVISFLTYINNIQSEILVNESLYYSSI